MRSKDAQKQHACSLILDSWIINEFEKSGKFGSAPGKQNWRVICPMGKMEFKYFSSPVDAILDLGNLSRCIWPTVVSSL